MKQNMKKIAIAGTMLVLVLLLGVAGWLILGKRRIAQQMQEEINALGIEWYSEDETEFTITTVEEFYEFAKLSTYYDFEGQTVKLGADLVLNEGNAEDWAARTAIPENIWESVYGFGGTFDGQGHTISGVYGMGHLYTDRMYRSEQVDYVTTGLFRNTLKGCVIKNFRLVNSFFDSDLNQGAGCVASTGAGTFDSIYVDAFLTSQKNYVGGIVGRATDDITITNCWFDGEINVIGGYARPTGGILAQGAKDKKVTIEHCLMSGEMYNDLYERGVNMGGIMGTSEGANVTITDCLVSGNLHNDWIIVGSAIGNVPAESVATLSHVYTVEEAWTKTIGHLTGELNGTPVVYEREKLLGYGGYQWTSLDFDNYWAAVDGGTPILKTFAEDTLSLDGVARLVDLSWYDDTKDTFEIHDLADFYGFALLSYSHNFAGKTVKLCTDITINTGKASDWAKNAPEYDWITIGSGNLPFEGTFDGQMHTISGVYLKTDKSYAGLFGMTKDTAVVKRFRLTNSYFESSAASLGSVAGRGVGTFDTIYSNAIVRSSNGNVAGLIGQVTNGDKLVLKNCWFDGSVKSLVSDQNCIRIGGLLGFVITNVEISNCLNSGTVDASIYEYKAEGSKSIQPYVGGFIGHIHKNGEARISKSMNVGTILWNEKATSSFGSIIGTASGDNTRSRAILSDVFATKESCKRTATGYISGQVLTFEEETLKGYGGYQWTTLDFNKYWSVVENDTSILKSFAKKSPSVSGVARMIDTSWYKEKETTYVLNDIADLYGFAVLSYTNDFEGKTVKLGADITVNTGNAADWANSAPANKWMSISSRSLPFAGTFDGQMHTISGLYLKTDVECQGMFSTTSEKAVIKNFSLKNSYFESDALSIASITGRGVGTFDTIYSDAIIVSPKANVAGFIAHVTDGKKAILNNCWFDGTIKCTASDTTIRRAGGLLGFAVSDADLTNCLNTGTIDGTEIEHWRPYIGGLVAHIYKTTTVNITESMGAGPVLQGKNATSSYGSVIGYAEKKATLSHVYATTESCKNAANGSLSGQVIVYDEDRITGYGGYQWTTLDFDKYWAVVLDDTSVLKSFATSVPSLAGVEPMLDISWYNDKDKTFTLNTEAEFFGFALLSTMQDFGKDRTFILGDDMNIANEGSAENWATSAPKYEWLSIGTKEYPFSGTFDGNGKEITGVYLSTDKENSGLFGMTADTAVIKDFSLKNSYFESTHDSLGSITGRASGTYSKIYSDAIVKSNSGNVGGFFGRTNDVLTMSDCWFNGSVTNTGNSKTDRYTGGLVGRIFQNTTMTNCLNTGVVNAEAYTVMEDPTITDETTGAVKDNTVRPYAGGLVGFMGGKKTLTMNYCVNAGELEISSAANTGYGSMVGRVDSGTTANAYDSATITDYCDVVTSKHPTSVTNLLSDVQKVTLANITGIKAMATMPGLFLTDNGDGTYRNDWTVVEAAAPAPSCFIDAANVVADTSWYDKSGTYELEDRADLYGFALLSAKTNFENETIKLKNNITINEGSRYGDGDKETTSDNWSSTVAPAYPWIAISQDSTKMFKGTFDGQGNKIIGAYMNETTANRALFAYVDNGAVIKDFSLINSYFYSTKDQLASIAGYVYGGTFEKIYSDAIVEVSGGNNCGGLVARVQGVDLNKSRFSMNNCWFAGSVTSHASNKSGYGGLVGKLFNGGYVSSAEITNCLNTGTISAVNQSAPYMGGLYGFNDFAGLEMTHCLNAGTINFKSGSTYCGLIGGNTKGTVSKTYTTSQTGLVFKYGTEDATHTKEASSANNGNALANMPELFTYQDEDGKHTDYWAMTLDGTPILADFATVAGVECQRIDLSWYDGDGDYTLSNASDLWGMVAMSKLTPFANEVIKLSADIDVNAGNFNAKDVNGTKVNSYIWPGIGTTSITARFVGTFDGNMHTISGIYCNISDNSVGLFREAGNKDTNTSIKNFAIENSYFAGKQRVGSIVGQSMGCIIDSVYVDAVVVASHQITGGFVGRTQTDELTMNNCWFAGSITNNSNNHIGGLVGYAYQANVNITNSMNTGSITSNKSYIGGLVGTVDSGYTVTITNSMNAGQVNATAGNTIGSILGRKDGTLTATGVYATTESCASVVADDATYAGITAKAAADFTGTRATVNAPALFVPQLVEGKYVMYWDATEYTPVLSNFSKYAKAADNQTTVSKVEIDVSWYDATKTTYKLADEADFYGFALLSKVAAINGFEGKTIELGANMDLNPNWTASATAPANTWPGIGDSTVPFKGDFDGKGHTIEGIYMTNADGYTKYIGLFRVVEGAVSIDDFKLLNSYFSSKGEFIGAVAGASTADMDSVYTNATVQGYRNFIGGLLGRISDGAEVDITNCCFKGTVQNLDDRTNTAAAGKYLGGFVGRNIGTTTFSNCLNAGTVSAPNYKQDQDPQVGGFVGGSTVSISFTNCLNVGSVSANQGTTCAAILGTGKDIVKFNHVYALEETCGTLYGGDISKVSQNDDFTFKTSTELNGDAAKTAVKALFDSDKWITGQYPILKTFASLLQTQ